MKYIPIFQEKFIKKSLKICQNLTSDTFVNSAKEITRKKLILVEYIFASIVLNLSAILYSDKGIIEFFRSSFFDVVFLSLLSPIISYTVFLFFGYIVSYYAQIPFFVFLLITIFSKENKLLWGFCGDIALFSASALFFFHSLSV